MLKDKGHIDKIFSEGLKDLSVQPRPELWGKISADIKLGRKRKRAAVIYFTLAAAASLLLLFTLSNNALFQQELNFNQADVLSEAFVTSVKKENTRPLQEQAVRVEQTQSALPVEKRQQKILKQNKLAQNQAPLVQPTQKREISMQMVLPKTKNEALVASPLAMKLFEKEIKEKKSAALSLIQDSLTIAYNMKMLKQFDRDEHKEKEWSILGQVSSAYSSYEGEKSGNKSEDGILSVGGGVKLNWQAGKKLALQTGIIYNKFGQQLGASRRPYATAVLSEEMNVEAGNNAELMTSAGQIKRKVAPDMLSTNATVELYESPSTDMIQSFEAIEIPFILRYSLLDKKFGLHVSGGVSTNLMVGNRVYDKNSRETLGETTGIRTTNFSTSFSLGMEYQLNSKFSLSMEPSLKYYLNSINKDSNFNYKPYSIGLSSGIRYKF